MWTTNHKRENEFLLKHRFIKIKKAKKFASLNHLLLRPTFCFGVTQNHRCNDFKLMQMCEQIFKKRQRHSTIQISITHNLSKQAR